MPGIRFPFNSVNRQDDPNIILGKTGGVVLQFGSGENTEVMLRLDRKYCLNESKTEVVDCNSADAMYTLGGAGALISEKDAQRLGLEGLETADNVGIGNARAMDLPVAEDDKLYADQTPAGKQARLDARNRMGETAYQSQQMAPVAPNEGSNPQEGQAKSGEAPDATDEERARAERRAARQAERER